MKDNNDRIFKCIVIFIGAALVLLVLANTILEAMSK